MMICHVPLLVTSMIMISATLSIICVFLFKPEAIRLPDAPCDETNPCPDNKRCCEGGCCRLDLPRAMTWMSDYTWLDNWRLFLIFASAGIVAACGAWWLCAAGGHLGCVLACCVRRAASERDSAGSCCAPPHYSRCGSFHLNPPPYSEVR
ncbi:hypothetical protein JYU34_007582 [Plutella xylostella]|uniref:Transmembrane protein n=1 Tax=Plutella xylostella TaxID=51655 RepID=A0ABQ7QQR9_PLUXY|nr:hypothetical protein JYU34_007582 [Plutella xylostella]